MGRTNVCNILCQIFVCPWFHAEFLIWVKSTGDTNVDEKKHDAEVLKTLDLSN